MTTGHQKLDNHRWIIVVCILICVSILVVILVSLPFFLQIVSGGAYYSTTGSPLPVNQSAEFEPTQTASLNQSQSPEDATFRVTVENETQYTVSRQDAVANPSHSLQPADARVIGTTLVIYEKSLNKSNSTHCPQALSQRDHTPNNGISQSQLTALLCIIHIKNTPMSSRSSQI